MDATIFGFRPEIVGAIAAVGGAVIGSLITVFGPELRALFVRKSSRNPLIGEWKCSWRITTPPDWDPNPIEDTITISSINRQNIKGVGSNPIYGTYHLTGRDSPFAMTLSFHGKGHKHNLLGIIIFAKSPKTNILNGVWYQYSSAKDGELQFVGGDVKCEKM